MLECGKNFKGTMPDICIRCKTNDDEDHRLNECINFEATNWANLDGKVPFQDIYSNDENVLSEIIEKLNCTWEFRYANGKMKRI